MGTSKKRKEPYQGVVRVVGATKNKKLKILSGEEGRK